ncbi:heavy-metal-associated domain-containing protein [Raineyella fluvialis]|uniref:Copper ion binding protein n=1 Tax=Raineyella fluvialis TaxID=2662261 RepID=A0A5Q2FEI2_9ACTN|nr:heavy-metal-associated domain-containing protein [Raineyella fluvialis]QGF23483.1 copper ion binding protein [Raineyella fluvialis]
MATTAYTVSGMTCDHCVASVTEEVGAVEGVTGVDVTLESGRMVVTSDAEIAFESIAAAVDEAGYSVVPA